MSDVTSAFQWLLTLLEQHANEAAEQKMIAFRAWDGVTVDRAIARIRRIEQMERQIMELQRDWAELEQIAAAARKPPSPAPDAATE